MVRSTIGNRLLVGAGRAAVMADSVSKERTTLDILRLAHKFKLAFV